jgi:tRNA-splicing ligase RtcB
LKQPIAPIEIPTDGLVPVRCFAPEDLLPDEHARKQLERLATVPGLEAHVSVLPDVHAKDRNPTPTGTVVVSRNTLIPRAIEYPGHNCGMRAIACPLPARDMSPRLLDDLFGQLSRVVPVKHQPEPVLADDDLEAVLLEGQTKLVELLGLPSDEVGRVENGGRMIPELEPEQIRDGIGAGALRKAMRKGRTSLGTLGAGNHFIELQEIEEILDEDGARRLGLEKGGTMFMMHTDSQRLGKKILEPLMKEGECTHKTDRSGDLWGVSVDSELGHRYLCALAAASHAGFANRAVLTHILRQTVREVLSDRSLALSLLYDAGHETIQRERLDGSWLWVHRHGASRALPAAELPDDPVLGEIGQPVTIPGSMGTCSYLGLARPGVRQTFHSVAHGAGRVMEKAEAKERYDASAVEDELASRGIRLYRCGKDNIAGQAPASFKNPHRVLDAMAAFDLVRAVARLRPIAVLKG